MTFYGYGYRHPRRAAGYIAGALEEAEHKRKYNPWISFLQSKMPELKEEYEAQKNKGTGRKRGRASGTGAKLGHGHKRGHGAKRHRRKLKALPKPIADEIKAQVASGYFY
jgi:hypothetical protein